MADLQSKNPSINSITPYLSEGRVKRFEALQNCLLPRSKQFNQLEKQRSTESVNLLMSDQSEAARRKLSIFIGIIDLFCYLFYAKPFRQLNTEKQNRVMSKFFNSPIGIIRKGFWSLNTIARLATYGQKELHDEIGYRLRNLNYQNKESF